MILNFEYFCRKISKENKYIIITNPNKHINFDDKMKTLQNELIFKEFGDEA
jgi:hypothetical protein